MSFGKVLGFLGLSSDVTGFEFDSSTLLIGLSISVVLQLLKNCAEKESLQEQEKQKSEFKR